MHRYLIKRLLLILPTMLLIFFAVYGLMLVLPATRAGGFQVVLQRMLSILTKKGGIMIRFRNTVLLSALGIFFTMLAGIVVGILCATHPGKWLDRVLTSVSVVTGSLPAYLTAIFLVFFFCVILRILPPFGNDSVKHFILPVLTIVLSYMAPIARMTRSSMIEVLASPYIRALYARGVSARRIIWIHGLRGCLVPVISSLRNVASEIVCGTLICENFFTIPGLGFFMVRAIGARNVQEVLAATMAIAFLLMIVYFVADIMYAAVDPRIRKQYAGVSFMPRNSKSTAAASTAASSGKEVA